MLLGDHLTVFTFDEFRHVKFNILKLVDESLEYINEFDKDEAIEIYILYDILKQALSKIDKCRPELDEIISLS